MTALMQFKAVFKAVFKNNFKKSKSISDKKSQKVAVGISIGFGLLVLMLYFIGFTVALTRSAIFANIHNDLLYLFILMAQFVVLFLGAFASMSYIFFSKDNQLLSSLPIDTTTIFLAKFCMVYVSELIISAIVILPTVTAYGITCIINGVALNAGFFILEILGVFLFPIIPLLIVTLLSLPLMFIVAFFRKRAIGNAVAISIMMFFIAGVYLGVVAGFSSMMGNLDEEGVLNITPQMTSLLNNIKRLTIFNKPIIDAMLGDKVILNLAIYLFGILILLGINFGLSFLFYRKGMSIIIEGDGHNAKKRAKKELVYNSSSLQLTLLKKEIKTLTNTPMLLVSSFMGILLGPLMLFFMFKGGGLGIGAVGGKQDIYSIGFISYVTSMMVGASNQVAIVGISREGKSLFTLKSLPLSAEVVVKIKVITATLINAITVTVTAIVFLILSPTHNIVSAISIIIICISCGFGANCIGLYNDLKNPNLNWNNITELTRNNRKTIKPVMSIMGVGFFYMMLGLIFSLINSLSDFWSYILFYSIIAVVNVIFVAYGYKKLFDNPQALLDAIEG